MKVSTTIQFKGHTLEIEGIKIDAEPATRDFPGHPTAFEMEKIIYKGVDVFELLADVTSDVIKIEEIASEKILG